MKLIKLFLITNILFLNIYLLSAQSAISFTKRSFDFGKIALEDGVAYVDFNFKSVGKDYLMIDSVLSDIQDVNITWEKRIYQKGKEGILTIGFEPKTEGIFKRKITVETNGIKRNKFVLIISGEVVKTGKPISDKSNQNVKPIHKTHYPTTFKMPSAYNNSNIGTNQTNDNIIIASQNTEGQTIYPIMEHGFALTSRVIDFQKICKGQKRTVTFKIKNNTGNKRNIYFAPLFEYIEFKATPKTLEAGEEGEISVTFDSKKCPIWGPYQANFSLITEIGSTPKNSPTISFKVDIFEDFNALSEEEKQQAPQAKFDATSIDLGKINKNSNNVIKFRFSNVGKKPLTIRKIIPANNIKILHCDGKVAAGENGVLELELNSANLNAGKYSNKIILQTNDPQNPKAELVVHWTI